MVAGDRVGAEVVSFLEIALAFGLVVLAIDWVVRKYWRPRP